MRYWSVLFGLAAILSVVAFVYAPFSPDWWLPEAGTPAHVISTFGREIDKPVLDHPLDHRHRLHRHPDRPGLGPVPVRRSSSMPRASRSGRPSTSTAASGSR